MTLTLDQSLAIHPGQPMHVARLQEELGVSAVLAQLLANRGLADPEEAQQFLFGQYDDLLDPELLPGIAEAADILAEAIGAGERIMVHGDYDADGVSATALLVTFLRDVGAAVEAYIPHRIDEGYGLSREGIVWASEQGFAVMVSVDCGSSSPEEVKLANSLGIRTVITDHHMVGPMVPQADAFVNPRAPGCGYAFPHLSGVGVAFKLVQALATRLGRGEPRSYLDFAAIGTVGDVVPLTGENRILVREGLALMSGQARPGIAALVRVAGLRGEGVASDPTAPLMLQTALTARDLAFHVAPRINACGRLEHARTAAELLLETDPVRATELAAEVDALNQKRRDLEAAQRAEAEAQVEARGAGEAIVEASADWHQGLVGITANRLLDRFGVPAFVISLGPNGMAKGSARGPAHLDLFACLTECRDLLEHFGGHPRAGGFSVREENIARFRERLQEVVPRLASAPQPSQRVDMELPLHAADLELAEEMEYLEPFGQGNPEPLFVARNVALQGMQRVKERHLRFVAAQGNSQAKCIAFGFGDREPALRNGEVYDVLYNLEVDTWRDERRMNLIVRDILTRDGRPVKAPSSPAPALAAAGPSPTAGSGSVPHAGRGSGPQPAASPVRSGASPAQAAQGHVDGPGDPAEVIDVRAHENRGRYLSDLVGTGERVTAVVRRGLADYLDRVVRGHGPQTPSNFSVLPFGAPTQPLAGVEHCVLYTPPPSVDALRPVLRGGAKRCHVLFGEEELAEEEGLVGAVTMTRERMEVVFRALKGLGREFSASDYGSIVEKLPPPPSPAPPWRVETVQVVVRVLVEMAVIREVARGRYGWTGERAVLERSETFHRYAGLGAAFAEVRRIFALPGDTLADHLAKL